MSAYDNEREIFDAYDIDWIRPLPAEPLPESEQPRRRAVLLGRPAVPSALTAIGVAGTIVAAALPWSGSLSLLGIRALAAAKASWLVLLLLSVVVAIVLGIVALVRPTRVIRACGVLLAATGAGLSWWAVLALPADRSLGPGPALAVATLIVLTVGQGMAAARRAPVGQWRWRPAAVAGVVAAVLLAGAGLGSATLASYRDVDATVTAVPPGVTTGTLAAMVSRIGWARSARLFDATGTGVLVAGQVRHGPVELMGVAVLDIRTGQERWHHYERGWTVREAAIVADTTLLVVDTNDGTMAVGFDAATGAERWRHRIADQIVCGNPDFGNIGPAGGCSGQLITGAGILFVGGPSRFAVTYVSARDGRVWPVPMGGPGCRPRGAGGADDSVYVLVQCTYHGRPAPHLRTETAVAFDPAGHRRWATPLPVVPGSFAGDWGPVFTRAGVVLFEQEQIFAVLDGATGKRLWTTTSPLEPEEVVTDGTRLIWSNGALAIAVDARTGDQEWRREWQFPAVAELPVVADGRLYLVQHIIGPTPYTCATGASLLNLDPATGEDAGAGVRLPDGAGNDCGPDVRDRGFIVGSNLVLANPSRVAVLN